MTEKKKYYVLPMFTYPSGYGLHVGHASNFSITDFVARQKKMQGYDVLYPTGYDSFGLPTENFAIKQGRSADEVTKEACEHFTEQMKECEFDFDWTKMFATSDPEYYKRTQWIFTKLFAHGLVYKKDGLVNRCNGCQTVLANDQVVDGKCERCETIIIQKKHPQRYIKITDYADKLLDDMEFLTERPEETKTHQRNWIGRSEGTEIDFIVTSNLLPVTSNVNTQETKNYIICDFDGVIGDSFETIAKAMEQMDNFGGIKFDVHSAMEHIRSYARKLPDHTKKTTLSEDELKRLTLDVKNMGKATHDLWFGLHREFIDTIKSLPNAHIAVVSSGSEEYVQPAVIQSGLEASHILCFEDHHSKEEKIENICKDWWVSIEDIYYITDSLADVYELKGFLWDDKIIWVTRGQCTRQELEEELASNQIIDNQKDITRYFRTETAESATTEPRTKNQEPRTITVFTTRPDTLYGVTAIVLAPENQIIDHLLDNQKHQELTAFRHIVSKLTSIDRQSTDRQKNGLSSGVNVRHPLTDELIPVRFADYVLADYATGSVMFVPAHDERDREFAKRYNIPIKQVIVPEFWEKKENAVSKQSWYWIVFNPKSNKYLCVYGSAWSHYGAHGLEYGFPGGSIDDGEDILQGTIREVTEETWYDDLILHEALGIETISHYFAHNKNTQRENKAKTYFFILNSEHQNVQHLEKNESWLVCERLSEEELQSKPLLPIRKRIFDAFQWKVITEWALINSDKFNGLDSEAAKTVISDYLTSIGRWRKKTTFRLRDWSVSRQRYRWSPIPIYYTFADNQKVPYYTSRDGFPESYGNWTQPGKPVITRHNAKVIIKHWSEEKYLLLHNETFGYHLVGGGIDEGETYSQAAIREAKEETPFENFKLLQELPGEVHNDFYQPRKQENRYLIEHFVALQLESDMQSETHLESHESFAYHWVDADKMGGLLQYRNEQHGWYQRYDPTQVPTHKTIDRYNAYNPHPDKTKRIPHAIPDSELPIILPLDLPNYKPAGKSPLEDHPTFKYYHKKEIIWLDRSTIDQRRIQTMLWIYSTIRSSTKNLWQETYLIGWLWVAVVSGFVFRKNDDLDLIISWLSLNQIKELWIWIWLEFKEQTNHTVRFEYKSIEIEVFSSEWFVEYSKNTMIVDYSQINTNEINFMDTNIRVFDKGFYLEFKKRVNNYYKNNWSRKTKRSFRYRGFGEKTIRQSSLYGIFWMKQSI
jgi:8-oxo-dGTP pyrophosphatase MutT (NUDIX family)